MDINLVIHAKDYIDDLARGINPITKENTNENDVRVTVIIGTRQKCSILVPQYIRYNGHKIAGRFLKQNKWVEWMLSHQKASDN